MQIATFRSEYSFLSNMYSCPIEWNGRHYRNAEAAFQSAKTLSKTEQDAFCSMDGPTAKRYGRRVTLRPDWEQQKLSIMSQIVLGKFSQNAELCQKLLETGDAELVEGNMWNDTYWGFDLRRQTGANHLGRILMAVRKQLGNKGEAA